MFPTLAHNLLLSSAATWDGVKARLAGCFIASTRAQCLPNSSRANTLTAHLLCSPRYPPLSCNIITPIPPSLTARALLQRSGMNRLYPQYGFFFEGRGEQFMMVAQKCSKNRTSNYHVFDMKRGGFQTVSRLKEPDNVWSLYDGMKKGG